MFDPLRVGAIAKAAMNNILLPARQQGAAIKAYEKTPGELVTSADLESQKFLKEELGIICPEARFLGEESQEDEGLDLAALEQYQTLWIVDPLDGTASFAAGKMEFAVMLAFAVKGVVEGAWICVPRTAESGDILPSLAWATDEHPAMLDGKPFVSPESPMAERPAGIVGTKYFDPVIGEDLKKRAGEMGSFAGPSSAGVDLLSLAEGQRDYAIYSRTLPWDFAAPLYWAAKARLVARRFSGASVSLKPGLTGLLCTRSARDWLRIHTELVARTSHPDRQYHALSESTVVLV